MEYLIGLIVGLAVAGLASLAFDRERFFYPTSLIVIASYYVLFAVMEASTQTLAIESMIAIGFLLAAVLGSRKNLWFVVAALLAHGLFDFGHDWFIENPGVAGWWPGFCLACDLILGGWLAVLLVKHPELSLAPAGKPPLTR
jgi:hypothetical protein